MALVQHKDARVRFDQQVENSEAYVLPFIKQTKPIAAGTSVMEVGCGEGGVLLPFVRRGALCLGVDMDAPRIELAQDLLRNEIADGKISCICKNIYDEDFKAKYTGYFDIIILKDVIEHIHDQEAFIPYLKTLLKPEGQIFFGFPPWYMPFGGHQQIAESKLASKLPWYHLMPVPLYKAFLRMAGETKEHIAHLLEIKETGITIERFERIVRRSGLKVLRKQHYLVNPIYKYKFGLKPRKQWKVISALPYFRDFITTCVYYTVG